MYLNPPGRWVSFWYTSMMSCQWVGKAWSSKFLTGLLDSVRLCCSGCSSKYSWRISLVETCLGTGTIWWYFDDENAWWINSATLCLHLPLSSDRLAPQIYPCQTTTWDSLTLESPCKIVHQHLLCLGIILSHPIAIMNHGRRVHKQFLQYIQEYWFSERSLATTRRTHDLNTGGCIEPKPFSKFYSIWEPILLFSRKCNLWGIHSWFCWW